MKNIKILLVDDEPDILEFIGYNLKKEGYELQKFIEQKLIVKGYTKEEIKKIDTN